MNTPIPYILLVDDDDDCNAFTIRILEKLNLGERVEVACDGVEALDLLSQSSILPNLILLDINMPRMNGWEFLEAFYQTYPSNTDQCVVIAMVSVSLNPDDQEKAKSKNLLLINKPLTPEKLKKLIENV